MSPETESAKMEVKCPEEETGLYSAVFCNDHSSYTGLWFWESCSRDVMWQMPRNLGCSDYVRWKGRYHSCHSQLHRVGTDWFCIASEDWVCRENLLLNTSETPFSGIFHNKWADLWDQLLVTDHLSKSKWQPIGWGLLGGDFCIRRLSSHPKHPCVLKWDTWPYAHRKWKGNGLANIYTDRSSLCLVSLFLCYLIVLLWF